MRPTNCITGHNLWHNVQITHFKFTKKTDWRLSNSRIPENVPKKYWMELQWRHTRFEASKGFNATSHHHHLMVIKQGKRERWFTSNEKALKMIFLRIKWLLTTCCQRPFGKSFVSPNCVYVSLSLVERVLTKWWPNFRHLKIFFQFLKCHQEISFKNYGSGSHLRKIQTGLREGSSRQRKDRAC